MLAQPSMSTDLNIIEHVWHMMGRRLEEPPTNLQQVEAALY